MSSNGHATAASYDRIARQRTGDMESKDIPFRHFNNYVKKNLIQFALDTIHQRSDGAEKPPVAVLDIASGRGGDIGKWLYMQSPASSGGGRTSSNGFFSRAASKPEVAPATRVTHYECYDISPECVVEAQRRFDTMSKDTTCTATFAVADCFGEDFLAATKARAGAFQVASIQFALHYACDSPERARRVVESVATCLAPGGVVLITTVDPAELSQRVRAGTTRNAMYSVELITPGAGDGISSEGATQEVALAPCAGYHFKLRGFVDCVEFVVPVDAVRACASACGLRECTEVSKPFSEFLRDYERDWGKNRGNILMRAEKEVATLYRTLVFQKL